MSAKQGSPARSRLERVIKEHLEAWADDYAQAVASVLADVRHLCDEHQIDYAVADREGYGIYLNELHTNQKGQTNA